MFIYISATNPFNIVIHLEEKKHLRRLKHKTANQNNECLRHMKSLKTFQ